jgi:hypothetical protein
MQSFGFLGFRCRRLITQLSRSPPLALSINSKHTAAQLLAMTLPAELDSLNGGAWSPVLAMFADTATGSRTTRSDSVYQ